MSVTIELMRLHGFGGDASIRMDLPQHLVHAAGVALPATAARPPPPPCHSWAWSSFSPSWTPSQSDIFLGIALYMTDFPPLSSKQLSE